AVPQGRARSPPGRTPPVLAPRTRPALRPATAEGSGAGEEAAVHRRRGRLPRLRPMEGWEVAPRRGPPATAEHRASAADEAAAEDGGDDRDDPSARDAVGAASPLASGARSSRQGVPRSDGCDRCAGRVVPVGGSEGGPRGPRRSLE